MNFTSEELANFEPVSFGVYRDALDNPAYRASGTVGMESEGLGAADYAAACNDARTVFAPMAAGQKIPLVTSLDHLPWHNQAYFRGLAPALAKTALFYFNHLPEVARNNPADYRHYLGQACLELAGNHGLLISEASEVNAPETTQALTNASTIGGVEIIDYLPPSTSPLHYHYADKAHQADGSDGEVAAISELPKRIDVKGYQPPTGTSITTSLPADDIEYVWSYYDAGFAELNATDPVLASFGYSDFKDIMLSPDFIKLANHRGGRVTNLGFFGDVRACEWINQRYYKNRFPAEYDRGEIWLAPGVITEPGSGLAQSMRTMSLVREMVMVSGGEPVISFICDDVSNQQVPRLMQLALTRGAQLQIDFESPDQLQVFQAAAFQPVRAT